MKKVFISILFIVVTIFIYFLFSCFTETYVSIPISHSKGYILYPNAEDIRIYRPMTLSDLERPTFEDVDKIEKYNKKVEVLDIDGEFELPEDPGSLEDLKELRGTVTKDSEKYLNNYKGLEILKANHLDSLEYISDLTQLKKLISIGGNADASLTTMKGIENLTNLESLGLRSNYIKDIEGLEKLTNLKYLFLGDNEISEIKGLENLNKLEELDLEENEIKEIRGLENQSNLKRLFLNKNEISEIKGLENLNKLEELYVSDNNIKEIQNIETILLIKNYYDNENNELYNDEFKDGEEISPLKYIDLTDNPLESITQESLDYINKYKIKVDLTVDGDNFNNYPNDKFNDKWVDEAGLNII